jgi:hypothetical protein
MPPIGPVSLGILTHTRGCTKLAKSKSEIPGLVEGLAGSWEDGRTETCCDRTTLNPGCFWADLLRADQGVRLLLLWVVVLEDPSRDLRSSVPQTTNWMETHRFQSSSKALLEVKTGKYTS